MKDLCLWYSRAHTAMCTSAPFAVWAWAKGTIYVFLRHDLTTILWNFVNDGKRSCKQAWLWRHMLASGQSTHPGLFSPGTKTYWRAFYWGWIGVAAGVGPAENRRLCCHFPELIHVSHSVFFSNSKWSSLRKPQWFDCNSDLQHQYT